MGSAGKKISFVGLGQMGLPMALNLLQQYPGLTVSSRRNSAYAELEGLGATPTDDPREIADSDIVFLSLPDDEVVGHVLFGPDGIAKWLRPGSTVVDTSTISYGLTLRIHEKLIDMQVGFLDAPVSGMPARAAQGTLTAMCGGGTDVFTEVRPYLGAMASSVIHMGPAGSGQLTKLINQLLFDINCAAVAEILPMAARLGLDSEKVAQIVNSGTGRSYASEYFLPRILADEFNSGYPLKYAYKDLVSAARLGAEEGIPLPLLSAATAIYQTALLQGYGDCDKGGMIKVYEQLLGVQFRTSRAD